MRIGILTFHFAHNYGAMLQAYALVTKLRKEGFNAEIIDYRHNYIYKWHEKLSFKDLVLRYLDNGENIAIAFLKSLKNWKKQYVKDQKWINFNNFLLNKLPISEPVLAKDLKKVTYDALICGSDQIWNPRLTDGLQEVYFCGIGKSSAIRISYAGSNGEGQVPKEFVDQFELFISQLNHVSLREHALATFIRDRYKIETTTVLDPVFLLDHKEWQELLGENAVQQPEYILLYIFDEDPIIYEIVDLVSKKYGLAVKMISYQCNAAISNSIEQIVDAGPVEFVKLFEQASYVITNSFHGTAFSILFNKQFVTYPPKYHRERIDSLVSSLGLGNRVIDNLALPPTEIDYDLVNEKLYKLKNQSLSFLITSLTK
ncbi:polysaccharide pyruvyl transferase family protein [Sphingobacterium multivorum]|uniref:polysaccharide pyruvyl transferase family protein n=1 Tax=Sphingobacterium multivorum TaxID=28454 RepID=UPI0028967D29|nr:polysaccharide pyruvyl transferase family protein [Sphingobacterium multivorum]